MMVLETEESRCGRQWAANVRERFNKLKRDGIPIPGIYGRVSEYYKYKFENENCEMFYIPEVISFGPYNYGTNNPLLHQMELLKTEVERRYSSRWSGFLDTVVQSLMTENTQKRITKIYGKEFSKNMQETVLMMVRDGCFMMEILERFSQVEKGEITGWEISTMASIDEILDEKRCHPLLNGIAKDMLKVENQLPLWVLDEIVGAVEICGGQLSRIEMEPAMKNLSPIEVIIQDDNPTKNKDQHILGWLHRYMVDNGDDPFFNETSPFSDETRELFRLTKTYDFRQVEELKKLGVQFKKVEGRGISHIKFDETNFTLYLPEFKVDDKSEVLLRNLMVFETNSVAKCRPICRYALLMKQLVDTTADVAILRKHNIIISKHGSDDDVLQFWNSVKVPTLMPHCIPIDEAVATIDCFRQNHWKVLWAQLKMNPWSVLSNFFR